MANLRVTEFGESDSNTKMAFLSVSESGSSFFLAFNSTPLEMRKYARLVDDVLSCPRLLPGYGRGGQGWLAHPAYSDNKIAQAIQQKPGIGFC
jgi:hypothetical protein